MLINTVKGHQGPMHQIPQRMARKEKLGKPWPTMLQEAKGEELISSSRPQPSPYQIPHTVLKGYFSTAF